MEVTSHTVYFSLGSNLGNRMKNLEEAFNKLETTVGTIIQLSSAYESQSWGYESQNNYLNCCLKIRTNLNPFQVLEEAKKIEQAMGRIKTKEKEYTDRIIDIDILFYDDLNINEKSLTIPHPHLEKRKFVLLPLNEISPSLYHNKHFLTIKQLLNNQPYLESISYYGSFNIPNIN